MIPKIATASQKIIDTRFFVRIRGALTPPPKMEDPVVKIPLDREYNEHKKFGNFTIQLR